MQSQLVREMYLRSVLYFVILLSDAGEAFQSCNYNSNLQYLHNPFGLLPFPDFNCFSDPLKVLIANGVVLGKDNGQYYSWEGMPYAEPPVGKLRFEPPQPYFRKWDYVFDATQPPKLCCQLTPYRPPATEFFIGQEDCLTVSVYKPKVNCYQKLPVIILMHGGSYMFGGNGFKPDRFMARRKVIIVKFQYRLGPLGFLSTQDATIPGNFGLKDQRLALHWIKKYISAFGGDHHQIMLYGHAAGGSSVHLSLMEPSIKNYFKVAVSISGNALSPGVITSAFTARERARRLGRILDCPETLSSEDLKYCLQQKDASEMQKAVAEFWNIGMNPVTVFGPVIEPIDAWQPYMTLSPEVLIKMGQVSNTPWLVTYTAENGGYNSAELLKINPLTCTEYIEELKTRFDELAMENLFLQQTSANPQQCAQELREKYFGNEVFNVDTYLKVQQMFTDVIYKSAIKKVIQLYRECGRPPTYVYKYSNPPDIDLGSSYIITRRLDLNIGTLTLDDVNAVFPFDGRVPLNEIQEIVSGKMIDMLIGFLKYRYLIYDKCIFEDNAAMPLSSDLRYTLITGDGCELKSETIKTGFEGGAC